MKEIELTDKQVDELKEEYERAEEACRLGTPGAILAQVWPEGRMMEVHFIDGSTGDEIYNILKENGYTRRSL